MQNLNNNELKNLVELEEKEAKEAEERRKLLARLKKARETKNQDALIPKVWNAVKKELNL